MVGQSEQRPGTPITVTHTMEIIPKEMLVDPETQVWHVSYYVPSPSFEEVEALPGVMRVNGGGGYDLHHLGFYVDPKVTSIEEVIHTLHSGPSVFQKPIIEVFERSTLEGWIREEQELDQKREDFLNSPPMQEFIKRITPKEVSDVHVLFEEIEEAGLSSDSELWKLFNNNARQFYAYLHSKNIVK